MLADQGHEGDGAEILFLETVFAAAGDAEQGLIAMLADGDHEPAAERELLFQRLGHARAAGRDDDRLVRRFVGPALGAVGANDLDIAVAEPLQPLPRQLGKLLVTLDGEHPVRHAAHHRRGVARSGADLEHGVAGLDLGKLEHARHDVGLGDGLPRLDRECGVLIGEFLQMLGHEGLARHLPHRREQQRIGDAAGLRDGAPPYGHGRGQTHCRGCLRDGGT